MPLFAIVSVVCLLGASIPVTVAGAVPLGGPVVVHTQQGELRGVATSTGRYFLGIPYAAPPVGALRWRPPSPPAPWTGVRDATHFGSQCPQAAGGSEDCLYLNVYTPPGAGHRGASLPVMVWIHGGSFVSGAGAQYDPTKIALKGNVIVVTINYRLGLLGSLALPQLDQQSGGLGSGTYGLQDTQAALRWVRDGIGAFGGRTNKVTVFGESAGAGYVCMNVVSPAAAGLFVSAISESGCSLPSVPLTQAEQAGQQIAAQLGCNGPDVVGCLRTTSVAAILAAQSSAGPTALINAPAVGGRALPKTVLAALRAGQYNHVPLIVGTNRYEGRLFVYLQVFTAIPTDQATYLSALAAIFGPAATVVAAAYPLTSYPIPAEAFSAALGDGVFSCPELQVDELASTAVPTYAYEFNDPRAPSIVPLPVPLGATHASELFYLFSSIAGIAPTLTAVQRALSNEMISYWTQLAATGSPNGGSLSAPLWPSFQQPVPLGRQRTPVMQALVPDASHPFPASAFSVEHHCGFWQSLSAG